MSKITLLCVAGTRPEAIKMAPVITRLSRHPAFEVKVLATAQHRHLLDQVFRLFDIHCDYDLDVMTHNQTLPELTAKLIAGIDGVLQDAKPDMVIAQGDTTTVLSAALAAFYRQIPFAHVEAGLRSHDLFSPFPEEGNRIMAGHLATLHFAPTAIARQNLLREGIADHKIVVTGNTVIDALLNTVDKPAEGAVVVPENSRVILVTSHRRENFGQPLRDICHALRQIVDKYDDVCIVFPVHPNPMVRETVYSILSANERIQLINPLGYREFVGIMQRACLILSDSGGVQEEAPALGKPVLVLREETERMAALEAGATRLVGTDEGTLVAEVSALLDSADKYNAMVIGHSPYGDGQAARAIVHAIDAYFRHAGGGHAAVNTVTA